MKNINQLVRLSCVLALIAALCGTGYGMGKLRRAPAEPAPAEPAAPAPEKPAAPAPEKAVLPAPEKAAAPEVKAPAPEAPKVAAPTGAAAVASAKTSKVLVKVNDREITDDEVMAEAAKVIKVMSGGGVDEKQMQAMIPYFKPQIVASLVTETLISAECDNKKITVSKAEVDQEIERIKANLPKNKTLQSLIERGGMTEDMFRSEVAKQVKLEKLLNITQPTEEEIKAFYEKNKARFEVPETVHARHILIKTEEDDDAAAKAKQKKTAEDLQKKLVAGGDFAKLAEENSDCGSARDGGDLGEFPRGRMAPAFEQAAFSLKTNEISAVVETKFGFHIIQALEHNNARTIPYEEAKSRIALILKSKKIEEQMMPLIESLKAKAKITYLDESVAPPDQLKEPAADTSGEPAPAVPVGPPPVAPVPSPK